MKHKYLILDFGKVIVGPLNKEWDFTPKFVELIDVNEIDEKKYKKLRSEIEHTLYNKVLTLDEEYKMFYHFYEYILSRLNIKNYSAKMVHEIAYDRTYNNDKYYLFPEIYEELDKLKSKYTLLLLSDNWPCGIEYMKAHNLDKYFDKMYISSTYGYLKRDKVFFDVLINEYNVLPGEALFVDDLESNLDVGKEKGFDCILMDRYKTVNSSKYKIVNNLLDL